MKSKIICGIKINEVDRKSAIKLARKLLLIPHSNMQWITSINPEKCGRATHNPLLKNVINRSVFTIPDGIGIVWLGRFHGLLLKYRITGIDFAWQLLKISQKYGLKVYLYGAKPDSNKCAKMKIEASLPGIQVVGNSDGYQDWEKVARDINTKKPDLLLIAMGGGKQEEFIWQFKDKLNVKLAMGVGGSFDVWAGKVERAPYWWRKLGMEWLYRIIKEPYRIPRLKYGISCMLCGITQMLYNIKNITRR